jgi:hypothetical protein
MALVAQWPPFRVHIGWWEEFGPAIGGHTDFPHAVVDEPVVVAAQENAVVQAGLAA